MKFYTMGHRLPARISVPLFGDRARHGLAVREDDPSWVEWNRLRLAAYDRFQKGSAGGIFQKHGRT